MALTRRFFSPSASLSSTSLTTTTTTTMVMLMWSLLFSLTGTAVGQVGRANHAGRSGQPSKNGRLLKLLSDAGGPQLQVALGEDGAPLRFLLGAAAGGYPTLGGTPLLGPAVLTIVEPLPDTMNPVQLEKVHVIINRLTQELDFLKSKTERQKILQGDFFHVLDKVKEELIPSFDAFNAARDRKLGRIRDKIKDATHQLGEAESLLAGGEAVARRTSDHVTSTWERIFDLVFSNNRQTAFLGKARLALQEARDKLNVKLNATRDMSEDQVEELVFKVKAVASILNKCSCASTVVDIDDLTAGGRTLVSVGDLGLTSDDVLDTVTCFLQGFVSSTDQHSTVPAPPSYGRPPTSDTLSHSLALSPRGHRRPASVLSLALSCRVGEEGAEVEAFDQSRGDNSVEAVSLKVCGCTERGGRP